MRWILLDQKITPAGCMHWAAKHTVNQQIDSIETAYRAIVA
jgi:hypothetical protein